MATTLDKNQETLIDRTPKLKKTGKESLGSDNITKTRLPKGRSRDRISQVSGEIKYLAGLEGEAEAQKIRDRTTGIDNRNFVEKTLNLRKNQSWVWDTLEIFDRPDNALRAATEWMLEGKNPIEGFFKGLSGEAKVEWSDILNVDKDEGGLRAIVDISMTIFMISLSALLTGGTGLLATLPGVKKANAKLPKIVGKTARHIEKFSNLAFKATGGLVKVGWKVGPGRLLKNFAKIEKEYVQGTARILKALEKKVSYKNLQKQDKDFLKKLFEGKKVDGESLLTKYKSLDKTRLEALSRKKTFEIQKAQEGAKKGKTGKIGKSVEEARELEFIANTEGEMFKLLRENVPHFNSSFQKIIKEIQGVYQYIKQLFIKDPTNLAEIGRRRKASELLRGIGENINEIFQDATKKVIYPTTLNDRNLRTGLFNILFKDEQDHLFILLNQTDNYIQQGLKVPEQLLKETENTVFKAFLNTDFRASEIIAKKTIQGKGKGKISGVEIMGFLAEQNPANNSRLFQSVKTAYSKQPKEMKIFSFTANPQDLKKNNFIIALQDWLYDTTGLSKKKIDWNKNSIDQYTRIVLREEEKLFDLLKARDQGINLTPGQKASLTKKINQQDLIFNSVLKKRQQYLETAPLYIGPNIYGLGSVLVMSQESQRKVANLFKHFITQRNESFRDFIRFKQGLAAKKYGLGTKSYNNIKRQLDYLLKGKAGLYKFSPTSLKRNTPMSFDFNQPAFWKSKKGFSEYDEFIDRNFDTMFKEFKETQNLKNISLNGEKTKKLLKEMSSTQNPFSTNPEPLKNIEKIIKDKGLKNFTPEEVEIAKILQESTDLNLMLKQHSLEIMNQALIEKGLTPFKLDNFLYHIKKVVNPTTISDITSKTANEATTVLGHATRKIKAASLTEVQTSVYKFAGFTPEINRVLSKTGTSFNQVALFGESTYESTLKQLSVLERQTNLSLKTQVLARGTDPLIKTKAIDIKTSYDNVNQQIGATTEAYEQTAKKLLDAKDYQKRYPELFNKKQEILQEKLQKAFKKNKSFIERQLTKTKSQIKNVFAKRSKISQELYDEVLELKKITKPADQGLDILKKQEVAEGPLGKKYYIDKKTNDLVSTKKLPNYVPTDLPNTFVEDGVLRVNKIEDLSFNELAQEKNFKGLEEELRRASDEHFGLEDNISDLIPDEAWIDYLPEKTELAEIFKKHKLTQKDSEFLMESIKKDNAWELLEEYEGTPLQDAYYDIADLSQRNVYYQEHFQGGDKTTRQFLEKRTWNKYQNIDEIYDANGIKYINARKKLFDFENWLEKEIKTGITDFKKTRTKSEYWDFNAIGDDFEPQKVVISDHLLEEGGQFSKGEMSFFDPGDFKTNITKPEFTNMNTGGTFGGGNFTFAGHIIQKEDVVKKIILEIAGKIGIDTNSSVFKKGMRELFPPRIKPSPKLIQALDQQIKPPKNVADLPKVDLDKNLEVLKEFPEELYKNNPFFKADDYNLFAKQYFKEYFTDISYYDFKDFKTFKEMLIQKTLDSKSIPLSIVNDPKYGNILVETSSNNGLRLKDLQLYPPKKEVLQDFLKNKQAYNLETFFARGHIVKRVDNKSVYLGTVNTKNITRLRTNELEYATDLQVKKMVELDEITNTNLGFFKGKVSSYKQVQRYLKQGEAKISGSLGQEYHDKIKKIVDSSKNEEITKSGIKQIEKLRKDFYKKQLSEIKRLEKETRNIEKVVIPQVIKKANLEKRAEFLKALEGKSVDQLYELYNEYLDFLRTKAPRSIDSVNNFFEKFDAELRTFFGEDETLKGLKKTFYERFGTIERKKVEFGEELQNLSDKIKKFKSQKNKASRQRTEFFNELETKRAELEKFYQEGTNGAVLQKPLKRHLERLQESFPQELVYKMDQYQYGLWKNIYPKGGFLDSPMGKHYRVIDIAELIKAEQLTMFNQGLVAGKAGSKLKNIGYSSPMQKILKELQRQAYKGSDLYVHKSIADSMLRGLDPKKSGNAVAGFIDALNDDVIRPWKKLTLFGAAPIVRSLVTNFTRLYTELNLLGKGFIKGFKKATINKSILRKTVFAFQQDRVFWSKLAELKTKFGANNAEWLLKSKDFLRKEVIKKGVGLGYSSKQMRDVYKKFLDYDKAGFFNNSIISQDAITTTKALTDLSAQVSNQVKKTGLSNTKAYQQVEKVLNKSLSGYGWTDEVFKMLIFDTIIENKNAFKEVVQKPWARLIWLDPTKTALEKKKLIAGKAANMTLFNFSDLSNFEKGFMRRYFTFSTWPIKNLQQKIISFTANNKRWRAMYRLFNSWNENLATLGQQSYNPDRDELPRWAQDRQFLTLPWRDGDKGSFIQISPTLISAAEYATGGYLNSIHPVIKSFLQATTGIDLFKKTEVGATQRATGLFDNLLSPFARKGGYAKDLVNKVLGGEEERSIEDIVAGNLIKTKDIQRAEREADYAKLRRLLEEKRKREIERGFVVEKENN